MLPAYLRPALSSSLPILYLMAPMSLYGHPLLEGAREFPFSSLLGFPVQTWVCEDLYRSNPEWQALWPVVSRRAVAGVFLDHLGGWVAKGTHAEVTGLLEMGKPVWWLNGGEPTERFGFGPPRHGDWKARYRRVGLGWTHPCLTTRGKPLQAADGGLRSLQGVPVGHNPRSQRRLP